MIQTETQAAAAPILLDPRAATLDDIKGAFRAGMRDLMVRPGLSLFFGLVYALFGAALILGLIVIDQIWIVIAAGVGFPLVAPFLAAGLYEMSRRYSVDEPFTARDIFGVVFKQQKREFGWMAFVVLFVFWLWAYQVRILIALFLQNQASQSLDSLLTVVFTTAEGLSFVAVGSITGGMLAAALFTLTVISMPLLLDKELDFVTAIITSVKAVRRSPVVMLGWGAVVGALTLIAIGTAFLGVIVIFPLLGHASWRLYERLLATLEAA